MEKKNGFHRPENQFPLAGIRLIFKNRISTSIKKSPNKGILSLAEISEKSNKIVAVDKSFK